MGKNETDDLDRKAGGTAGRLQTLDLIRGLTMISMILYHGMWDLLHLSRFGAEMNSARMWYEGIGGHLWQQSICRSFILLAGFCVPFSRHIFRRGLTVSVCGILVSVVTVIAMYDERVLFGVLTFHGAALLLTGAGQRVRERNSERKRKIDRSSGSGACAGRRVRERGEFSGRPGERTPAETGPADIGSAGGMLRPAAGTLICVLLFHVTRWVNRGYLQLGPALSLALPAFLYKREGAAGWILTAAGFPMKGFFSTDYFSLFPWIFLFHAGTCLCRLMENGKVFSSPVFHLQVPFLNGIGRHPLVIYLLHQPLLYLLVSVIR